MLPFKYMAVLAFMAVAFAQDYDYEPAQHRPAPSQVQPGYSGPAAPKPTPVAILKQINRHNEDGSYTYGYEGGDGSFKIETKLPTGEVKGKYGYTDDTGKVRVVEYGATKYGFEPSGEGITVAPPTLVDETTHKDGTINREHTGAYYPDPEPQPAPQYRPAAPKPRPPQQPVFDFGGPQQFSPAPQQQQPRYNPAPQQFSPAPQQFSPAPQQFSPRRTAAPVPQRAAIPGAVPVTQTFDFGPPQRAAAPVRSFAPAPRPAPQSFARATPIEEDYDEPAPAPVRAAPRITYAQPAPLRPAPNAAPQYAPRPNPGPPARSGGILDQLSKDYALPAGGAAPLHDISFGYY